MGDPFIIHEKANIRFQKTFRSCIQKDDNDLLIWGTDNFSQFPRRDASISSKCDRGLAIAKREDIVVLRGHLDCEYQNWLHSHGLGSESVVEYGIPSREMTLSQLIVNNPEPILRVIEKINRKPVYLPWFSGQMENEAANALGAELFGASESETIKYNDKASFKTICWQLDIDVINGDSFEIDQDDENNYLQFENSINHHLLTTQKVIIRGTMGEAGMSLYRTNGKDIAKLYRQIIESGEKVVMIEPFLKVDSSPNDQWVIDREGYVHHIGMREQICERGMVYIGTLKGKLPNQITEETIYDISQKIVGQMARSGYRGVIGIDYIITDKGIYPIETNARFNGSTYAGMIVENIEEKLKIPVPYWKFIKTKTLQCSFPELIKRMESILYDGKKINCVFPYDCKALSTFGNFAVLLLTENLDQIIFLENSLKKMGIKR